MSAPLGPRNAAVVALQTIVAGAYRWKSGPTRRLKLFADVPAAQRPAVFLHEGGDESYAWSSGAVPRRTIEVRIFVYIDARDPRVIGAAQLNDIMDALDQALAPAGADLALGRTTLAGTPYMVRITGRPVKVPGDLDGDGLLVVPVAIELP
ncbi:hypothetical protein [Methylobacterium radiotolerans]|uniref:hypothetical protein n=1 Tax=Methylobacterium radiotolerans TaxID=31998 RepID=UPI0015F43333|nr:hypothetical protein [Methylobacterium radiotolerans]